MGRSSCRARRRSPHLGIFGHTIVIIASGGKTFSFLDDRAHHQIPLLEKPMMEFAYDSGPKQSAKTRVRLHTMLAEKQTPVMSFHIPWPGFGNLAKAGEGFRYVPQPIRLSR